MKIPRAAVDSSAELSFAQQRLWFLEQFLPGTALYNIPLVFDLDGPLDVEALERTLLEIVRRHEPLRTVFLSRAGTPWQRVDPPFFRLDVRDLTDLSGGDRAEQIDRVIDAEISRPFDLAAGPIFRAFLLRDRPSHHVLVGVVHHIVFDAWSAGVFVRELAALYGAYATGQAPSLPEVPIRYVDFSIWQRDMLRGAALSAHLEYWKQQLRPPRSLLSLPADRPRPAAQSHHGHRTCADISDDLFESVEQLSRREGVTPFITLLATYATLFHRYTGQEDILIGAPIANRTHQELEPLIGFFVNTLALRLDLSGAPTFRTLLQRARRVAFGAYAHQDLPFEMLVEELKPERSLSHAPILQTMLVLDNTPRGQSSPVAADVRFTRRTVATRTSKFDVTLLIMRADSGRQAILEASADLFDLESGERMLGQFIGLLETLAANPDQAIARALPLPARDRQRVDSWNDTARTFPEHDTVHGLFEKQAAQTPDADAVLCGEHRLSYRTLNARANRLARVVRGLHVTAGDRVGICVERTASLPIALLAILKAGAAYVPLDPNYPSERLAFIARDADITLLLTSTSLQGRLPSGGWRTVCVDAEDAGDAEESTGNLPPIGDSSSLAYVMYTSGSTGRPKGVAVEHRSVVNLVSWAVATFGRDELSCMLASTSISFDLSVFEFFVPLASGGAFLLVENLLAVPSAAAATRVTFVNTVPSAMTELLRLDALPPAVKTVALGGEPLPQPLVARLYDRPSVRDVFDLYGPTEATVYATCARRAKDGQATIGRPIANMNAFVLDPTGQPALVGVPGELYLAGEGLARGYLGAPDLTAERFVPNPFTADVSARMYRTGDRVRWLPDGNLEFIGRLDHQVKVRGFRIELGEIEAVLTEHPAVREAVVVKREEGSDDARLVAYVAAQPDAQVFDALRAHLARRLPDYMIPAAIVALEELPRLPNGKVDRSRLPAPAVEHAKDGRVDPRNEVEQAVARIWCDVLKLRRVGVTDDFFELGGHSLLATQVIARLRDLFASAPDLQAMFSAPTVESLARFIEANGSSARKPQIDSSTPAIPYPRDESISTLFEAQAARTPGACAVAGPDEQLSYADLDARANRLAHVLKARGVGPDVIVGLCLARSVEQVVALLAILKAGGAYLPLDLADPESRLATAIDSAGSPVVVTSRALLGTSPVAAAFRAVRPVLVDDLPGDVDASSRGLERPAAESLAYTLFTSGSTGRPKAVAVPHRAVVRLVYGLPDVPLGEGETVLHLAPLTFDASTFEIWGPLLHGGRVAIAPDRIPTAIEIEQMIREWHVTVLWLTATLFNTIIDVKPDALSGVRHLLVGGEALSVSHVAKALDALPNTRLINGYGPTEATTFACCYPIERSAPLGSSIPIGRPLSNTRVYVVDRDGRLASVGAEGELWIGGDAVARGYLNDESATAERFGSDPFSGDGGRIYRTGDRARLRADGALEFLGRLDDQVKVRGYRIEPAEVEAALEQHPDIARAAVAARRSSSGDNTLVGYIVAARNPAPDAAALRQFLHQRLPAYMVPTQFVALSTLPLRPSGKIDRQALPAPVAHSHPVRRSRTEIEAKLSAIWEEVLGRSDLGIDDDFFDVGGHSLMAVRLVADIESHFGIRLPLSSLLKESTIEKQARLIADGGVGAPWSPIVPLQPDGSKPPFFLVHGIGGEVLTFTPLARHMGAHQPVFGLCVNAMEGPGFYSSVEEVASRYVEAIRTVAPNGPYRIGGYSSGGVIAYEMAQQLRRAGERVTVLAMLDCAAPGASKPRRLTIRSAGRLLKNALFWPLDDDFIASGPREQIARLRSKVRLWRARARSAAGRDQVPDVRDRLGLWLYPPNARESLEAHARMVRSYRPKRYTGTVTVLRARTMSFALRTTPDLGWGTLADAVSLRIVRGAHDTILKEPRVRELAATLDAALSERST